MIAIDCEPGLLNAVLAHLEQELSQNYPKKVITKGQKLNAASLISANLAADDLQALVEEKGKRYRVRMALPLLEANGYSYAYCSCREQQLDLDEQRCHHLWLAQQTVLRHLQKQITVAKSQRPPWLELADLLHDAAREKQELDNKAVTTRLQWQLDSDLSCSVYQQTYSYEKKNWGRRQKVSWKRLCTDSDLWSTRADQALAARVGQLFQDRPFSDEPLQAFSLLWDLSEHPQVFRPDGVMPLKLARAELAMQVEVNRHGLQIDLNLAGVPLAQLLAFPGEGLCGYSEANDCLYLCPLSNGHSELASSLREPQKRSVPTEYKHLLLDQLAAYQSLFPIQMHSSDLPTLISQGSQNSQCSQNARALTYLRLTPLASQGLIVEFLLKPLPAVTYPRSYFRPGHGPEQLWDCARPDALLLHIRDLPAETQAARSLAAELGLTLSLDENSEGKENSCIWQLTNDSQALELLAKLHEHEHKDRIIIEWPEDAARPYEIVEPKEGQEVKLEVTKKQDWFCLQGELSLDGEKVDLLTLLQAFRSKNKYIKLANGKWLRICAQLEKRLAQLDPCITYGRLQGADDLRLSPSAFDSDLLKREANTADWQGLTSSDVLETLEAEVLPPQGLRADLRPYQREGYAWLARLYRLGLGGILADDMGLGKTLQTIALLLNYAHEGPSLIVCPASVQANWDAEIRRFAPTLRPLFYREHRDLDETLAAGDVLLCSYGLLLSAGDDFSQARWNIVVADEAQYIKNAASKSAQQLRQLRCRFALALTGTPIENSVQELWSIFHWVNPELLGSWQRFKEFFLAQSKTLEEESQKQEKLRDLIKPFILRRLKADHLSELPSKTEITLKVYLSTDERRFYDQLRMEAIATLKMDEVLDEQKGEAEPRTKFKALAYLTKLRQLVCHPRLLEVDWSDDSAKVLEFNELCQKLLAGGHRALVFSQFPSFLKILQAKIQPLQARCLHLDGSTSLKERQNLVTAFQAGQADFFFISLKAGGTGLNLTAADYVLHMDPWWNPAVEAQATDRAYRMGQEKPVTIYRFVTQLSIEDKILNLHAEKRLCAETILQGTGTVTTLSLSDLKELFQ